MNSTPSIEDCGGSCGGAFDTGREILAKIRLMGFAEKPVDLPLTVFCGECNRAFPMVTFETACPHCGMVYAVTPCQAFSSENVKPAGLGA